MYQPKTKLIRSIEMNPIWKRINSKTKEAVELEMEKNKGQVKIPPPQKKNTLMILTL